MHCTTAPALTQALTKYLSAAAPQRTGTELLDWLIDQYNLRHAETPLRTPSTQGSRLWSERLVMSDKLDRALNVDPTGATFMALLLPDLRAEATAIHLPLCASSPAATLIAQLEMAQSIQQQIHSVLHAPAYQGFANMTEHLYAIACRIKPDLPGSHPLALMQEQYPDTAAVISKSLHRMDVLRTGKAEAPFAPLLDQLNEWIVRCNDESMLLPVMQQAGYGFTLCAILLEDRPAASYFALIAKTPDRTVLFRDQERSLFPGQGARRRLDRHHESRIKTSPFPYSLLDLVDSPSGRRLQFDTDSTTLALHEGALPVLANIADMEGDELIRLLTCMHLIGADWASLAPPQLAQPAQALLSLAPELSLSQLPALMHAQPIMLPWTEFTVHKLTQARYIQAEIDHGHARPDGNWVAEQLLPEVLALIPEQPLFHRTGTTLQFVGTTSFASALTTEQGVQSDLCFLARTAQAELVRPAIERWKEQALPAARTWLMQQQGLREHLARLLTQPELLCDTHYLQAPWDPDWLPLYAMDSDQMGVHDSTLKIRPDDDEATQLHKAMRGSFSHRSYGFTPWFCDKFPIQGGVFPSKRKVCLNQGAEHAYVTTGLDHLPTHDLRCPFDGEMAQVFVDITVKGFAALSYLTGVSVSELPPFLRVLGVTPLLRNSILDRTDPVMDTPAWNENNPICISMGISISTLNRLRAEQGLSRYSKTALKTLLKPKKN